jgi:hypothetical protein
MSRRIGNRSIAEQAAACAQLESKRETEKNGWTLWSFQSQWSYGKDPYPPQSL